MDYHYLTFETPCNAWLTVVNLWDKKVLSEFPTALRDRIDHPGKRK